MNTLKLWGLLAVLLVAAGGMSWWLAGDKSQPDRVELKPPPPPPSKPATDNLKNATMQPGRVVVLDTTRGKIEFVMFEKDCPKTTARIAMLVQAGAYNGIKFPRVENWVIQTAPAMKQVPPMGIEVVNHLLHGKGSVGMARSADLNSNTNVFYITLEPAHHLDLQYTNFGRVINGIDVAMKIKLFDTIKTATIRPMNDLDRKRFNEVLTVEAERRTQ